MKGNMMSRILLRFFIVLTPVMLMTSSLYAQGANQKGMGGLGSMLPMLLAMFAIIYFFMIRPEQKKSKERQKLISALKKGDKVLTAAGIMGTVSNVKDTTVMVKIAESTTVEFAKSAITTVLNPETAVANTETK
jgi:preprotein translocase subunit YajC